MRLRSFRVRNYKSVSDSGDCWLASDLTVLAGKNESGKTAILEALRDFSVTAQVSEDAEPLTGDDTPEISVRFDPTARELEGLLQAASLAPSHKIVGHVAKCGLEVTKNFDDDYLLSEELVELVDAAFTVSVQQGVEAARQVMTDLESRLNVKAVELPADTDRAMTLLEKVVEARKKQAATATFPEEAKELVTALEANVNAIPRERPSALFLGAVVERIPKFVFFSDFQNLLPPEVPVGSAAGNESVRDFAVNAQLDLDVLASTSNPQKRANLLSRHSDVISGEFLSHWQQDKVVLHAVADGELLRFWVREDGNTEHFKVGQRSRGFQWFLSFFLRLKAQKSADNVILIDEPGLFLHATAQRDVLKVLETVAGEAPRHLQHTLALSYRSSAAR